VQDAMLAVINLAKERGISAVTHHYTGEKATVDLIFHKEAPDQ